MDAGRVGMSVFNAAYLSILITADIHIHTHTCTHTHTHTHTRTHTHAHTHMHTQSHPSEALSIAKSLYYDFCVLLPDAADPLLQLATHSPTFARQLTIAFTTLHPFHLS